LELLVGTSDPKVELIPLIKKRLHKSRLNGTIRVVGDRAGYAVLSVSGKDQIFPLSDILADIMMETVQIRFLIKELSTSYFFIGTNDKHEILTQTLKQLWQEKPEFERTRQEISNRIALCIIETKNNVINLDGILRFRMKDQIEHWQDALSDSVDSFMIDSEKQEFIKLLRYFACMHDPKLPFVKVIPSEDTYVLLDDDGKVLEYVFEEHCLDTFTKEDLLLSQLLDIAPETIDATELHEGKLKELLKQVFIGRLR
jgi:putative sporulation protein YtxC